MSKSTMTGGGSDPPTTEGNVDVGVTLPTAPVVSPGDELPLNATQPAQVETVVSGCRDSHLARVNIMS